MTWDIQLNALLLLTAVFAAGAFMQRKFVDENHLLRGYLLAGNSLKKYRVINLLWSTSFSLNGMLYQVWLGYAVGAWGLLTQAVWAASFFWLARHSSAIISNDSLHGALGRSFQPSTRVVAGLFSLLGAMALIGWEANVGQATFSGLVHAVDPSASNSLAAIFTGCIVLSSVLYTVVGGLRGNAIADLLQSILKMLGFATLIALLYFDFPREWSSIADAAFPSIPTVIEKLGLLGLITNLAFSVVWQFVDMSAWQTVIAGAQKNSVSETRSALRWGGIWAFIAPGIIGTLLGVFLTPVTGVDSNNVMAKTLEVLPTIGPIIGFLLALTLIACLMSMIDGLLLASGYALVVDILKPGSRLDDLDSDHKVAKSMLSKVRLAFFVLAIIGTYGIAAALSVLNLSIFDIVYFVIIPHLSLAGPVFASLQGRKGRTLPMWFSIAAAASVGLVFVVLGTKFDVSWAVEGAGLFTIATSVLASRATSSKAEPIAKG